ncbi:MAG: GHKL domain-containing protein [Gammaproteobacteria bacterium]|nr:MAG: GHKL domain-containing protein [Gammaproteobacteria bacterium]
MLSLNARSLIAASVILAAFLGLTGLALDNAFRNSAEEAVRQRLEAHLYGLLAIAELDDQGVMQIPESLPDERFIRPGSGLYAQINDVSRQFIWRSKSQLGYQLPEPGIQNSGVWQFTREDNSQGQSFYILSFGVSWETGMEENSTQALPFTFSVIESLENYQAQVNEFRHSLWGWLGLVALVLLLTQIGILRWSLSPLNQVEKDLRKVESGDQESLIGIYPKELTGLTNNLNILLHTQRHQLMRYRDALADLAHSLKTPLAVLRGAINEKSGQDLASTVHEQEKRMTQIVSYQLQRAATSGRTTLMHPLAIAPLITRVVSSMDKVYAEKKVRHEIDIPENLDYRGDEGDLMELFGNLLDNAYKWCQYRIFIYGQLHTSEDGNHFLHISVEDDGQGIPPEEAERVLERGRRADCAVEGQGIGLAVVSEIIHAYQGELKIESATLGGTRIDVFLKM